MLVVVLNTFRYSRYLLVPERNAIHLVLHAEAQPRDMVQAYLQVRCPTDDTVRVCSLAWLGVRVGRLCTCARFLQCQVSSCLGLLSLPSVSTAALHYSCVVTVTPLPAIHPTYRRPASCASV